MASVHERLSEQFYKWEIRGRGWQVFNRPVHPEPPFKPFHGHYLPDSSAIDDGRRPTFLSSLFRKPTPSIIPEPEEEPEPDILVRESLIELQTSLPADLDISKEAFEHFLTSLSSCQEPVAFELLGLHQRVFAQFALHANDEPLAIRQLQAYFPDATFVPQADSLKAAWDSTEGDYILAVEFGLEREFMFPLASGKLDPFIGIIGALSDLKLSELGLFQVLFQPVQNKWRESIVNSVTHSDGKPFFVNMPELARVADDKVARPLYAAVVRLMVRTDDYERTLQIARDLGGSLRVFSNPNGNALIPLSNEDYDYEDHITDVLCRQSRRSGMVLNADELIGFVHLPSSAIRSPVLQRSLGKTKAAPDKVRNNNGILLGENSHMGQTVEVRLGSDQRVRHTHIIGASGKGKSTLLFNLIKQDIENGEGVGLLDPHGDLVDKILGIIPPGRSEDVVLVDLSDQEYSVSFNILTAHSETEKSLLASDLVSIFRRLSTSWGDQMNSLLGSAILAFLESDRGGTISDLRRFLIEPEFRAEFLKTVRDSEMSYYWGTEFPTLPANLTRGSIVTRLQEFLAKKPIRYMVSQRQNKLNFAEIMDTGKIFLAKLPEGIVGRENSFLLGSLLVSKFQLLAMARQEQKESQRRNFWLYIDEFSNFISPSMAQILRGTRKYRLGLTLAHQELRQLERDSEVASAVMSNCETRIIFGVSDDDARKLAQGLSFFEASDLQNLAPGQAICRVEKSNQDFNLLVPPSEEIDEEAADVNRQAAISKSQAKYSRSRLEVEAELRDQLGVTDSRQGTASPKIPQPAEKKAAEVPQSTKPIASEVTKETPSHAANIEETNKQHTATKERVGKEAEALDYTVHYEEHVPSVKGRADLILRRGTLSVVVQVSVATPVNYEVESVQKFLQADFQHIAVICNSRKKLLRIQQSLSESLNTEHASKVGCYTEDELITKLYDWAAGDPGGGEVEKGKPHKRNINFNAGGITKEERQRLEADGLKSLREKLKRKPPN